MPQTILLSGSSGLIGGALLKILQSRGDRVIRLVRAAPKGADEILLEAGLELPPCDAVIHLAGEPIAQKRWTSEVRTTLLTSRTGPTRWIAEAISQHPDRVGCLLTASATGYYGADPQTVCDESTPAGNDFLASICTQWEEATRPALEAGVRVLHARFGVVLAREGGALAQQLLPFRLGLGAVLGSGNQVISWISLEDALRAILHMLATPSLAGPVNLVAPGAVTNREFGRTLSRVLRRPFLFTIPGFLLRILVGEVACLILGDARIVPARLLASGFQFQHPELESALRAILR